MWTNWKLFETRERKWINFPSIPSLKKLQAQKSYSSFLGLFPPPRPSHNCDHLKVTHISRSYQFLNTVQDHFSSLIGCSLISLQVTGGRVKSTGLLLRCSLSLCLSVLPAARVSASFIALSNLCPKNRGPVIQLRSHYFPHVYIWHGQCCQHHPPPISISSPSHYQSCPVWTAAGFCIIMQRLKWGKRCHSATVDINRIRDSGGETIRI